jgi:hypothetical protein
VTNGPGGNCDRNGPDVLWTKLVITTREVCGFLQCTWPPTHFQWRILIILARISTTLFPLQVMTYIAKPKMFNFKSWRMGFFKTNLLDYKNEAHILINLICCMIVQYSVTILHEIWLVTESQTPLESKNCWIITMLLFRFSLANLTRDLLSRSPHWRWKGKSFSEEAVNVEEEGIRVTAPLILNLVTLWSGELHAAATVYAANNSSAHWIRDQLGPWTGLNVLKQIRNSLIPAGIRKLDGLSRSRYAY